MSDGFTFTSIDPPVAQLVEQLPFKEMVAGSIPAGRTIKKPCLGAFLLLPRGRRLRVSRVGIEKLFIIRQRRIEKVYCRCKRSFLPLIISNGLSVTTRPPRVRHLHVSRARIEKVYCSCNESFLPGGPDRESCNTRLFCV
jgi:hypothetical protein